MLIGWPRGSVRGRKGKKQMITPRFFFTAFSSTLAILSLRCLLDRHEGGDVKNAIDFLRIKPRARIQAVDGSWGGLAYGWYSQLFWWGESTDIGKRKRIQLDCIPFFTSYTLVILHCTSAHIAMLFSALFLLIALKVGTRDCGIAQFLVSQISGGSQGLAGSATSEFDFLANCRSPSWNACDDYYPPMSTCGRQLPQNS